MKYVDYPLPDEKLINILSKEYSKNNEVCALSNLEQVANLSEVYYKITKSNLFLEKFKKMGATYVMPAKEINNKHLDLISSMGIKIENSIENVELGNSKTCFFNYLKCEMEILKAIMFLIFLDNLNFNKNNLITMLNERINVLADNAL